MTEIGKRNPERLVVLPGEAILNHHGAQRLLPILTHTAVPQPLSIRIERSLLSMRYA